MRLRTSRGDGEVNGMDDGEVATEESQDETTQPDVTAVPAQGVTVTEAD